MKTPDYPANELERLQTLRSLNILDTEPEERFDRLTRMARRLFNVPIALVSLIDAERQWFKSRQGLDACETSRDISFCGHAILDDALLIVPDALLDTRFHDNPLVTGDPKIRFYASAPLIIGGCHALGTICLIDQVPRTFSDEDRALLWDLGKIAEQELVAIQLSLFDELKQRNAEMRLLSEMSDFLQACLTVDEACTAIANLINPLFPRCHGGIFIVNPKVNAIESRGSWGPPLLKDTVFSSHDCWALRRGRTHWVDSHQSALRCKHIPNDPAIAVTLCIPLTAQGETLGLFYLSAETPEALSEPKQQLARTVAEQVALAIANLNLRESLQHQSIRDRLTGLFNRHYLEESLQQEIARAQHHRSSIGVIMLDMDHFKQFNDTYGQEAGDYVLQVIATILKSKTRELDIVCRYGGEEFALMLPESSPEETIAKAEEIRGAIAQSVISHHGQLLGAVTASMGVACFLQHGATSTTLLQSADAALYRAKLNGRNQVVVSP